MSISVAMVTRTMCSSLIGHMTGKDEQQGIACHTQRTRGGDDRTRPIDREPEDRRTKHTQ